MNGLEWLRMLKKNWRGEENEPNSGPIVRIGREIDQYYMKMREIEYKLELIDQKRMENEIKWLRKQQSQRAK